MFVRRITIAGVLVGLVGGCSERPVLVYQPRVELSALASNATTPDNAYAMLRTGSTTGLFACSLAVARLDVGSGDPVPSLELGAVSPAEQGRWVEALRGISEIADIRFLDPVGLRPFEESGGRICEMAARLHAPLLLMYVSNRTGPNEAQTLGVLYDVQRCAPIATLHTEAGFVGEDARAQDPDQERGLDVEHDAQFQSRLSFEQATRDCIAELIARDTPASQRDSADAWETPATERWWLLHKP